MPAAALRGRPQGGALMLPRELTAAVRNLDEAQLRRLAILVRGRLAASDDPSSALDDVADLPEVRITQQRRRCNRGCEGCPHGPYWYASWREDGHKRSVYLGAELAGDVAAKVAALAVDDPAPDRPPITQLPAARSPMADAARDAARDA